MPAASEITTEDNISTLILNEVEPPLVSVVIPAYNSATYISSAIDSALSQDYPSIELIVVDDGSTDRTVDVVSRYGAKLRIFTQENQGSGAARNLGIRCATGKYIAFLDADDVWWEGKIRYQIDAMTKSGHRMAYSRFIWWHADSDGRHESASREHFTRENPNISTAKIETGFIYHELLLDCIVWTSTVIVERSVLVEDTGMFDETLRKGQDYDLWLRLSRNIEILGLEKPTALYRIHPQSITSSVKAINYEHLILSRALTRWGESGPDGRTPPPGLVAARLARSLFAHGLAHLRHGDPAIATESFRQAIGYTRCTLRPRIYWFIAFVWGKLMNRGGN